MYTHTRSVAHKVFDAWRSPGRFTKNPDIVRLDTGRLLFVYSDTDFHWSMDIQIITIIASDDDGLTWRKFAEVDRASLKSGDERLVTPRLSLLSDGRLAVICDHDDFGHFHENQGPGNWIWWSTDGGETWSEPDKENRIEGFEPDRIIELPDGRLAVGTHVMLAESQMYAEVMSVSEDDGKSWHRESIVAHDGYHFFCEGAMVLLDGGKTLACVMRENRSNGTPCFVAFSDDMGKTWTDPMVCPFALHRPYAKQLADGRVFVTGRHVNGGLGTYGWVGDLKGEAGTHVLGGPRLEHDAEITGDELRIRNAPGNECAYTLYPPEGHRSEFLLEADVRIEGSAGGEAPKIEDTTDLAALAARAGKPMVKDAVAFLSTGKLAGEIVYLDADRIWMRQGHAGREFRVDLTKTHTISIHHKDGLLTVRVDGEIAFNKPVHWEGPYMANAGGGNPSARTQFGSYAEGGASYWKRLKYEVKNPTLPDRSWSWTAADGLPDRCQKERLIQIHANDPDQKPNPDHGYSSWLTLPDGRIILVDYTNCGDEWGKSHVVGVHIDPEDLA